MSATKPPKPEFVADVCDAFVRTASLVNDVAARNAIAWLSSLERVDVVCGVAVALTAVAFDKAHRLFPADAKRGDVPEVGGDVWGNVQPTAAELAFSNEVERLRTAWRDTGELDDLRGFLAGSARFRAVTQADAQQTVLAAARVLRGLGTIVSWNTPLTFAGPGDGVTFASACKRDVVDRFARTLDKSSTSVGIATGLGDPWGASCG